MEVLDQFLTLPMLVLCLVIWVLVWTQRKVLELVRPSIKESKLWRELFLPLGPPGTGALVGLIAAKFPFPDMLTSISGRMFVGVVCGLCSGLAYRMLKQFFASKSGGQPDSSSNTTLPE